MGWFRDWASYIDAETIKYGIRSNVMDTDASRASARSWFRNTYSGNEWNADFIQDQVNTQNKFTSTPTTQEREQAPPYNKIQRTHH